MVEEVFFSKDGTLASSVIYCYYCCYYCCYYYCCCYYYIYRSL